MAVLQKLNYGKISGSLNDLGILSISPPENLGEFFTRWLDNKTIKTTNEFRSLVWSAKIALEIEPDLHKVVPFDLGYLSIEGSVCNAQIAEFLCPRIDIKTPDYKDNPIFDISIREPSMVYSVLFLIENHSELLCHKDGSHNLFVYRKSPKANKISLIKKSGFQQVAPWHYYEDYYTTQAFHITGEKLFFPIIKSAI